MKETQFYLEEDYTSHGSVWEIRQRSDDSIWAKVYDESLAKHLLKQANKWRADNGK